MRLTKSEIIAMGADARIAISEGRQVVRTTAAHLLVLLTERARDKAAIAAADALAAALEQDGSLLDDGDTRTPLGELVFEYRRGRRSRARATK